MVREKDIALVRPLNEVLQTSSFWRDSYCTTPRARRSKDAALAKAGLRDSMLASLETCARERKALETRAKFRLTEAELASMVDAHDKEVETDVLRHFHVNPSHKAGKAWAMGKHWKERMAAAGCSESPGGKCAKHQAEGKMPQEYRIPLLEALRAVHEIGDSAAARMQTGKLSHVFKTEVHANGFDKSQTGVHWLTQKDRRIEQASTSIQVCAELPVRPVHSGSRGAVRSSTKRCVTPASSNTGCSTPSRSRPRSSTPRSCLSSRPQSGQAWSHRVSTPVGTPQNVSPWRRISSRPQSGQAWSRQYLAQFVRADALMSKQVDVALAELTPDEEARQESAEIAHEDEDDLDEEDEENVEVEEKHQASENDLAGRVLEPPTPSVGMTSDPAISSLTVQHQDIEVSSPPSAQVVQQSSLNIVELVFCDDAPSGRGSPGSQSAGRQTSSSRPRVREICSVTSALHQQGRLETDIYRNADLTMLAPTAHKKDIKECSRLDHAPLGSYCPIRALSANRLEMLRETTWSPAEYVPSPSDLSLEQDLQESVSQANSQALESPAVVASSDKRSKTCSQFDSAESQNASFEHEDVGAIEDMDVWRTDHELVQFSTSKFSDSIGESSGSASALATDADATEEWVTGRPSLSSRSGLSRRHPSSPVSSRSFV